MTEINAHDIPLKVFSASGSEELRPKGRSVFAKIQGRLRRHMGTASLDLGLKAEACALARGQTRILYWRGEYGRS
ncbi:hypothetical protein [Paracandidimonas soli]|uniref:hypothetical protein n=1 Tax=Paracandidimonas soli TaxID=1917182 RepID=UPI001045CB14|nr:hypothetical protein [Paracandidimonas soli]